MDDSQIAIHTNPAWRHRADFIICAEIDKDGLPLRLEQLWAREVARGRFEICCIPFFVYDLALGDEVETMIEGEQQYMIQRVVKRSGHRTFRVWFGDSSNLLARDDLLRILEALGCELEWSSENLLAIDTATADLAQVVANILTEREVMGHLIYETGVSK